MNNQPNNKEKTSEKEVIIRRKFQFNEILKQLDELSKTQDRLPEEPFPNEIVEHLRLESYPIENRNDTPKVSAPKGFLPRTNMSPNLPLAKGVKHKEGASLIIDKKSDTDFLSYIPRHLGVKTVVPTVSRKLRSGITPMENKIQVTGAKMDMFPWSCIGVIIVYLDGKAIKSGTGFMVGPNLLMTASHVMPWEHDGKCTIKFIPGYHPNYQPPFGSTTVSDWYGVPNEGDWDDLLFNSDANDLVICRTNDPMGTICGWLGTQSFGDHDNYYDHFYNSLGYPDFAKGYPVCEFIATIKDVDGDNTMRELETDNFGGPGWSGGPLFGFINNDWRAVGVCHGFEVEAVIGIPPWNANLVFAGGKWMVDLVNYGYANYNYTRSAL